MRKRLIFGLVLSSLISTVAFAQETDDLKNTKSNQTGVSAPSGEVGAVLGIFFDALGEGPTGLDGDVNGNLLTAGNFVEYFFVQSTTGNLVSEINLVTPNTGNPIGITTNGSNIFITDADYAEVDIYTPDGNYVSSFSVAGFSTFPEGITYAPFDSNFYVVNGAADGNNVGVFALDGTPGTTFPINGSSQDGIEFDNKRCMFWIYDSGTDSVRGYDTEFNELLAFAGPVAALGVFSRGQGVGVVGDSLFVIDNASAFFVEFDITDAPLAPNAGEVCFSNQARFTTTKSFDDINLDEVEVTLSCNTGIPLQQTTTLAAGDPVTFVVGDFNQGELSCVITEAVPTGYAATYAYGEDPLITNSTGCEFTEITGGTYSCDIFNEVQPVEIEVTKVWIDENPQFNGNNTASADWACSNLSPACGDGMGCEVSGNLAFYGNPGTQSFYVLPHWNGATTCSVNEVDIFDGGIEMNDSDCQGLRAVPGAGNSCTINNTRIYEGIPTLSHYGLAILILLMAGFGFISIAYRK